MFPLPLEIMLKIFKLASFAYKIQLLERKLKIPFELVKICEYSYDKDSYGVKIDPYIIFCDIWDSHYSIEKLNDNFPLYHRCVFNDNLYYGEYFNRNSICDYCKITGKKFILDNDLECEYCGDLHDEEIECPDYYNFNY